MREEMVKLEKVKKSCRISKILSKILACIVTAGFVCTLVAAIVMGAVGTEKINAEIEKSIDSGDASFELKYDINVDGMLQFNMNLDEMIEQGEYAESIIAVCLFASVVLAAVAAVFWMLVSIFKMIADSNTPFTVNILKRLKAIFIMVVIIAALASGLGIAVVAGCIGWSLYTIFDYGFIIQQEIDETL